MIFNLPYARHKFLLLRLAQSDHIRDNLLKRSNTFFPNMMFSDNEEIKYRSVNAHFCNTPAGFSWTFFDMLKKKNIKWRGGKPWWAITDVTECTGISLVYSTIWHRWNQRSDWLCMYSSNIYWNTIVTVTLSSCMYWSLFCWTPPELFLCTTGTSICR